jgi:hypothetical protein
MNRDRRHDAARCTSYLVALAAGAHDRALDNRYDHAQHPHMSSTPIGRSKADLSGWLTLTALFWFEAWGLMELGLIAAVPLLGFMHGTFPR